jgi:putative ABC transport system permease protein
MIERLRADLVGALRSLRTTPAPVVAAILTLAVAAGVNLAMFGLIDRALLSPPAGVDRPERLFTLGFQPPGVPPSSGRMTTTSYATFADLRDQVPALAGAAAFQRVTTTVILDGEQRSVSSMLVSGEYFAVLRASPFMGRAIEGPDNEPGVAVPAAVVSYSFWRSALAGDPSVIGRRLSLRNLDYVITGVMPRGFSGHSSAEVDLWVSIAGAMRNSPGWDRERRRNFLTVLARLADGEHGTAAETQATAVTGTSVSLRGLAGSEVTATEQRVAWWLGGVSLLVLVAGLANTATLLMVRSARTRYDIAVRAALGASRRRLIGQALIESLLIALTATAVAALLASWLDEAVRRVLFPGVIAQSDVSATTIVTAAVAGLLGFVVSAATQVARLPSGAHAIDLAGHLPGGAKRSKTVTGLLIVQTALSVLLLAGAGMFGGSLYRLWSQDFGMAMDDVVIIDFELGPERVAGQDEVFLRALEQVRQLPGVASATTIDAIPFSGFNVPPISVPGRTEMPAMGRQLPYLTAATPEYLQILGIQLVEGRMLTEADARGPLVVLVNQAMAQGVWPGESAVGKCIRIGFDPDFDPATAVGEPIPSSAVPCREIVGVVGDVRQRSVLPFENEDRLMNYFVPFAQVPVPPFVNDPTRVRGLLMRMTTDAGALTPAVRRAVVGGRTDLPFVRVRPYAQLLERQMRPWSMGTTLLGLFSALALAVASVGLFAAFAHAVSERRREMAIRMAVGARPAGVLAMVMREALMIAAVGAAGGAIAAVAAGRWIQALLFGTQPSDPLVLGGAAAAMLLVAALATVRPARIASQADPSVLLKTQ